MNKIKRILSMVLVCIMTLALFPVVSPVEVSAAEATGTTALFNGNATYLLQERFEAPHDITFGESSGNDLFSGWDVDYRGGSVKASNGAVLTDEHGFEKVSMNHQLMRHSLSNGSLAMESVFAITSNLDEGFYYEMAGNGTTALKIEVVKKAAGGTEYVFAVNGTVTDVACVKNAEYHVKAEFAGSKVVVYINGAEVTEISHSASVIDEIEIGTTEQMIGTMRVKNVFVYINYTVNESFLGQTATGWEVTNGNVTQAPGAPYKADPNAFSLNAVREHSYAINAPRVSITAQTADDYGWTGGGNTVKVSNYETDTDNIGRTDVVKVTDLGKENSTSVGILFGGNNFAFEEGDVITYRYDVYDTVGSSHTIWVRNESSKANLEPFYQGSTEKGTAAWANTKSWTTITGTIAFSDLVAGGYSADKWKTPGMYVLLIRTNVEKTTVYLDNFEITVSKAGKTHFTDVRNGERLKIVSPLDLASDLSVKGSTPPKITKNVSYTDSDGVTRKGFKVEAKSGDFGRVGMRLPQGFSFKNGDVLEYTIWVCSEKEISSSGTTGVVLRNAPKASSSTPFRNVYSGKKIPAGEWTKVTNTITFADVATGDESSADKPVSWATVGDYELYFRVSSETTYYISDFEVSVRNPEDAKGPSVIVEADEKSELDLGTPNDVEPLTEYKGRKNVLKVVSPVSHNDHRVGVKLPSNLALSQGDVITYSVDIYSENGFTLAGDYKGYDNCLLLRNHASGMAPFRSLSNAEIVPAGQWYTLTASIPVDSSFTDTSGNGKSWGAGDYRVYLRLAQTYYIDNFKVTIHKSESEIGDFVDGSRLKVGGLITNPSQLTDKGYTPVGGKTIGGRSNVVYVANTGGGHGGRVGIKLANGFAFQKGDVLEYSIDVYPVSGTIAGTITNDSYNNDGHIMLRNGTGAPRRNVAPKGVELIANTWNTITNRIEFGDDLTQNVTDGGSWDTVGNYGIYLRYAGEYYISNFTAKVIRPECAFGEPEGPATLKKSFTALSGMQSFSFDVFVPNSGADGFAATFGGANFSIDGGKFYLNGEEVYAPTKNVWYTIEIQTNGTTANIYVNNVLKKSDIAADGTMDSVTFTNNSNKSVLFDNVKVEKAFNKSSLSGYPVVTENPSSTTNIGMLIYPMWREGTHYGWDLITPYEERTPYLGYYTGGSREVADWDNKWLLEHGFDHAIIPFTRPDFNDAGAQPNFSVRGETLDAFLKSEYKKTESNPDGLGFAIMLTNPSSLRYNGAEDFKNNVVPFIKEHYFKNPAYKSINNGALVYMYNPKGFENCFGGTTEGLAEAMGYLNDAAIECGYTNGITLLIDISGSSGHYDTADGGTTRQNTLANKVGNLYKWYYSRKTDKAESISDAIANDYSKYNNVVASVSMGFDNTAWGDTNDIGTIDAAGIKSICQTIVNNKTGTDPNLVVFTCWDEWGEGHYFAPSERDGFGYLNAVRETFTSNGTKTNEDRPSEDAVKRMSVLYPEGRQILKTRNDDRYTTDDATLFASGIDNSLTITTDKTSGTLFKRPVHYEKYSGLSSNPLYNGYKGGTISDKYQATITYKFDGDYSTKDLSDVTAILVTGYAENSAEMVINLGVDGTTANDGDFAVYNGDEHHKFTAANPYGDKIERTFVLLPKHPDKMAETKDTKQFEYVRFNPTALTAVGSEFKISKIEFYKGELPGDKVIVDGKEIKLVSETVKNGSTTLIPSYKFLIDIGAKVKWDKNSDGTGGKLYVTMNGVTAVYQSGATSIVDADNTSKILAQASAPHYYSDGNLFVDAQKILEPFGYKVTKTTESYGDVFTYKSRDYETTYNGTDFVWEFEKDGDTEGWTSSANTQLNLSVRDDMMHARAVSTDTHMYTNLETAMAKGNDEYKYFYLKYDPNTTDAKTLYLRLYDTTLTGSTDEYSEAGGVVWIINLADYPDGNVIIDLSTALDRHNKSPYASMGDITKVRIDPVYGKTGSIYIDTIKFSETYPIAFELKAYSFSENMFVLDKNKIRTNFSGITGGTTGELPPLASVDGYENVIELIPSSVEGSFYLSRLDYNYDGNGDTTEEASATWTPLKFLARDNRIVKVSFWYKGIENGVSMRFENRTGNARDREEFVINDVSSSEWKYFEGYLDLSQNDVTDGDRWFYLRITRKSEGSGVYIRDYSFRCLDESKEVFMFTDTGVAFKAVNNTTEDDKGTIHLGAFDSDNVLTNFESGSNPRTVIVESNIGDNNKYNKREDPAKYHYISPTATTTEIRAYLWDDFKPLTEPFVLQKAN